MDWEITEHEQQIDTVGNIYQKTGGVIPKVCQECKKEFDAPITSTALKQAVPIFNCKDCSFETDGAIGAMEHLVSEPQHKMNKKSTEKIVGYETIIDGNKSIITKIVEDDDIVEVKILCVSCNESQS